MGVDKWLAMAVLAVAGSPAMAGGPVCIGFLNVSEQGYKLEGARLEPTGPTVAAGTQLEFNGLGKFGDKYYLTRSRSDEIFDSAHVELTSGCDLPDKVIGARR